MTLLPNHPVPPLQVETVHNGIWDLAESEPEQFTLVVFYRGLHCSQCQGYLKNLRGMLDAFHALGTEVIAVSCDSKERAEKTVAEWKLEGLRVGYEFPVEKAEEWRLFVSDQLESSRKKEVPEPKQFTEPGLFLIDPQGRLYASCIQNMPFARPPLEEVLQAIRFIRENDYPARGQAIAA